MNEVLAAYGWDERWAAGIALEGYFPARVVRQEHDMYRVVSAQGELTARVSGRMMYDALDIADYPAVGDWVLVDRDNDAAGEGAIRQVLPRRSAFVRKAAGSAQAVQVVAANVDKVFICMALNENFNLRRLERYLTIAWDSGALPVVVLTKSDLCTDLPGRLAEAEAVSVGCTLIVCSALAGDGVQQIRALIAPGVTAAFIGSSGVGKSTLINVLLGEKRLATAAVGDRDRGRHTTTGRALFRLAAGGMVIDTPGMRELQLESGDLSQAFADIAELACACRFRDCTHTNEPGCAVLAAVDCGALEQKRLESYHKLQRELGYEGLNSRQMEAEKLKAMFGGKQEMKQTMREIKQRNKRR